MIDVDIRPGTDTRYPSVRVRIGVPQRDRPLSELPEIALVFRRGETRARMQDQITAAVHQYVQDHPSAGPTATELPAGVVDVATIPDP